jgi:hypothetical protein
MTEPSIFAVLHRTQRIWAISSIHGDVDRLNKLQAVIEEKFAPGDRLLYLGNVLGRGDAVRATVDAMLTFRRVILSRRNMFTHDVVMLRGAQEEMWQRLMQLQFAIDPVEVLDWMLDQGIGSTLEVCDPTRPNGHHTLDSQNPNSVSSGRSSGMAQQPKACSLYPRGDTSVRQSWPRPRTPLR